MIDTAFVSFIRKLFSRSVFQGGRDHSSHRLKEIIEKYKIKEIIVSFKVNGVEKKKKISILCGRMGLDITISLMRLIIGP